jgi:hypothetical protein
MIFNFQRAKRELYRKRYMEIININLSVDIVAVKIKDLLDIIQFI